MKSVWRMPLAASLAMLFAAAAALIFSIAGVHLYQSLSRQLQLHDDAALLSTIDLLRHQLEEMEGIELVRNDPHRLLDVVLGQKGLFLALKDSKGVLLAASKGGDALLPTDSPIAVNRNPDAAAIRNWHGVGGKRGRVITAWGQVGQKHGDPVMLILAREELERTTILNAYRKDLLWTVLLGALAAALLAYVITRRGLRPLQTVARAAGQVTANQLGERLRIEDAPTELEDMVRAFNRMLDRLEESFRRLTQFSSDIAHDLRTPISNLMIGTQVALTQQRSAPEYESLLVSNTEEYERLTRMIESMLFLSRADNAQIALRKDTISVDAELRRIAEYFEGTAEEANVALDVEATGNLIADSVLFQRAVSNLVANAIRFTPSGERITIRGHKQGDNEFVVAVSNPGGGIPPEHLPRIFDRFYRIDTSRGASQSSSGLGLAIVKSIVVLHGGRVQVKSLPNGLTTFSLIFPMIQRGHC